MDGIAAVEARIQQIRSQFALPSASGVLGASDPNTAAALELDRTAPARSPPRWRRPRARPVARAQPRPIPASRPARARSTAAGVDSVGWARDFLSKLGMPITSENVKAVTAWEQAEGTKASFNPLATTQSGFSGETRFNSVGVKNYATYQDGIDANVHALTNGRYTNILSALQAGNDATAVAQAIKDSPWGTGGGVLRVLASEK